MNITQKSRLKPKKSIFLLILLLLCSVPARSSEQNNEAQSQIDQTQTASQPHLVAVFRIGGYVTEGPGVNVLSLAGVKTSSVSDLIGRLDQAGHDDSITSVLLSIEHPAITWAQIDELRAALGRLSRAGKKTYAYVESMSLPTYLLACACEKIIITPTGPLMLTGLSGRAVYLKNLLDKLGIQADFVQMGRFKGAAEPLTRTGPSEAELQQINYIFDALYDHLVQSIAHSRQLTLTQVRQIINQGPFTAQEALDAQLVDLIMYRKEFLDYLGREESAPINLEKDYALSRPAALEMTNPFAMMAGIQQLLTGPPEPTGDAIGVLYIDGPIVPGESREGLGGTMVGSRTIRMALAKAQTDENVKAVVVRIDSPGGSATASDIIYQAIRQCAEVKPVVASMGSVAASGGYYVACGAPTIMAQTSTITGSIGVVAGKISLGGLLEKLGITTYGFHRGRNAEMFTATRCFTPLERLKLYEQIEQTYEIFKQRVTLSRGPKLKDHIEFLAQGKIYAGARACNLGLVDMIGGLDDAIKQAAQLAGIEKYHLRALPKPKSLLEVFEDVLTQSESPTNTPTAYLWRLSGQFEFDNQTSVLWDSLEKNIEFRPIFQRLWALVNLLQYEQTLLMSPYVLIIEP